MKPRSNNARLERGVALLMFTLALPALLGLTIMGVDLGNLYLTRDKLNLLNRSAAATAVNIRALHGWAPFACKDEDSSLGYNIGYKCADALDQPAPQGKRYGELVQEISNTLTAQLEKIFPDAIASNGGNRTTNELVEYGITDKSGNTTWSKTFPATTEPVYNLKDDTFKLRVRYAAKTILLSQLASLLDIEIADLCNHPSGIQDSEDRCWVTSSENPSTSATTSARVIMLLDTSGSMQKREKDLKEAAGAFVDYFNPFKDEIGIISYGTAVKQDRRPLGTFNTAGDGGRLQIKDFIKDLGIGGQTNPCDALIESAKMIDDNQPNRGGNDAPAATRTFVVLFTDGAPNVYRLRFCDPKSSVSDCKQPTPLQTAAKGSDNDWYGWTVKWGRRKTYPDGSNGNPVYDSPLIKDNSGGLTFDTSPDLTTKSPKKFRINEKGEFMIRANSSSPWYRMDSTQGSPPPIPGMPYTTEFHDLQFPADNYLWNGPSYLVNRSGASSLASVQSLIDRVDPDSFKTCGIPKAPSGSDPDQFGYNHSLYFASRVLDTKWRLDRLLFTSTQQQHAVHLVQPPSTSGLATRTSFPYPPDPTNLTVPFYASDSAVAPKFTPVPAPPAGCLDALDAEIPVKEGGEKLFVGAGRASFWSNTDAASIGTVGEIIKTAELPYYCAVRTADYLRKKKNTTVFAVGLGPGARYQYGETCQDPMQNALDFDNRKDFFLQRLAMAPEAIAFKDNNTTSLEGAEWRPLVDFNLRQETLENCGNHPLQGRKIYLGFAEGCSGTRTAPDLATNPEGECKDPTHAGALPPSFSSDDIGGYYPTSDASKLKAQFGAVAKQILFRLSL